MLPVLQGILFLLAGFIILSRVSPRARRWLDRLRERFPGVAARADAAGEKANAMMRRFRATGRGPR